MNMFLTNIGLAVMSDGIGNETIAKWVNIVRVAIEKGRLVQETQSMLNAQILEMIEEDRDPTDEEWNALKTRSDAAHDAIQEFDLSDDPVDPDPDSDTSGGETAHGSHETGGDDNGDD